MQRLEYDARAIKHEARTIKHEARTIKHMEHVQRQEHSMHSRRVTASNACRGWNLEQNKLYINLGLVPRRQGTLYCH